ncbi:peptidase [Rouxiella sp. T17]|uniref:peptidase n=1 Tax=Rouxiella sp. T17 TaxID=3085684 RepID=UPI002FCA4D74
MVSRRNLLIMGACGGALTAVGVPVFAKETSVSAKGNVTPQSATAITEVFGDGVKFIAVAVEYNADIDSAKLSAQSFDVAGRSVREVFTSHSTNPADRASQGRFVIITLSPQDSNAALAEKVQPKAGQSSSPMGNGGPGKAGDVPFYDTAYKTPVADVVQTGNLTTAAGKSIPKNSGNIATTQVENLIVDDFKQLTFDDPKTGKVLHYNLFVPKNYQAGKSYPLVLFMHDAGATSDVTRTTLLQGLGAVSWASKEDQARHPSFVLAPQYPEIIADDDSHTSVLMDTTINLIKSLSSQYSIDPKRLYTTGQSGGCMTSIAMDIKYPRFFAASFLVAGQWDPALTVPLAKQKLWILVSQDDDKAFPGQNAITAVLEKNGATISRATWDGRWSEAEFKQAFDEIEAKNSPINYVTFKKGTVIPAGESTQGASGHRNTWRIAYTIAPIRDWIFKQHR